MTDQEIQDAAAEAAGLYADATINLIQVMVRLLVEEHLNAIYNQGVELEQEIPF